MQSARSKETGWLLSSVAVVLLNRASATCCRICMSLRVLCDSSEHDHSPYLSADVSIFRYREKISQSHPGRNCILQSYKRIPTVSNFCNFPSVQARRVLYLRSLRTRHVGLGPRTKILSITNENIRKRPLYPSEYTLWDTKRPSATWS